MNYRQLGRCGLQVSPICFGGNVFGWTVDEATSFRLLDAWVDAGMNFIDTADVCSRWVPGHVGGESEAIIGRWLRHSGKRDRIVLATKVGKPMGDGKVGLAPAYIRSAVDLGQSGRGGGVRKYLTPKGFAVLDVLDAVAQLAGLVAAAPLPLDDDAIRTIDAASA